MKTYNIGFDRFGVDLNKVDSKGYTTCPECSHTRKVQNQKKKVLKVYEKTGYYKCNHCHITGRVDSDQWINEQHDKETGLTATQAQPKPQVNTDIKPFHFGELQSDAIEFLSERGISEATAKALKVAYNKSCLCINYYKGGEIFGAKYRKLDKKFFWQHAGCDKYLYNLDNIAHKDEIILVEGEFDVMAIYEAGFKNVGSVSQGAPNAGSEVGGKLECLENSTPFIKEAKKVIIWTDNDQNGRYLQSIFIQRFGADRCYTVSIPNDLINMETGEVCKDANDVLMFYGPDKVQELIDNAFDVPIAGVRTVRQVEGKMWSVYHNGYRKGVKVGIDALDPHFSYYKPWWNLDYGIPGSGKSEFSLFKMVCMSAFHKWKWACFVPEAYPAVDFYNECIRKLTGRGVDIDDHNRLTEEEYKIALDWVNKYFFFVFPSDDTDAQGKPVSNNFRNVLDKIKELKLSKDIDGFLIDPINQLSASSDIQGTKDEKLEQMYSEIDLLCKTHFLSGNLVAHPRTLYKEKDQEDYRAPTPYEIAGGAMNYNKAYIISCVHRQFNQSDKLNPMVTIDIQKVKKHKVAGKPGEVTLNFDRKTGWYRDLRGGCVLEGFFESLCPNSQLNATESLFTDKLKQENISENGYDLNECPF